MVSGPDAQKAVGGDGRRPLRRSRSTPTCRTTGCKRSTSSARTTRTKQSQFENVAEAPPATSPAAGRRATKHVDPMVYRSFPADLTANLWGYMFAGERAAAFGGARRGHAGPGAVPRARPRRPTAARWPRPGAWRMAKGDASADSNGGRRHAAAPPRPPAPDLSQGRRPQEPRRDGVLLPAPRRRRRRHRPAGVHHAGGADQVEVPRLRPRQRDLRSGFLAARSSPPRT